MPKGVTVFTTCAAAVMALTIRASEKPAEAYQEAMKSLGVTFQSLRDDVKAVETDGAYPDYMPVEKDAATMKRAFAAALAFWRAKQADDAVNLLQDGVKGVEDLQVAMKEKSYDGIVTATAAIGKTCGTCHMAHREPQPDGTFEIK